MFLVRLRLFVDWHLMVGHTIRVVPPSDQAIALELAEAGLVRGLPSDVVPGWPHAEPPAPLGVRNLRGADDVEDASLAAMELLGQQVPVLASWVDPAYMAVSELCGNALQHGRNPLHAYVAADRTTGSHREFRLAIADLGIGIPEHVRARHPEWYDDTAAIVRALERGVTGTADPHRGNGFAEVFDDSLAKLMTQSSSAVTIDLRSGEGRVVVELIDGRKKAERGTVGRGRRGTWITYVVRTV